MRHLKTFSLILFICLLMQTSLFAAKFEDAPDFTLKDLKGRAITLSNYQGKSAVLLSFWATWCPYCKKEIPELVELQNRFRGHGLTILSINVDPNESVSSFVGERGINYPVLLDKQGAQSAGALYNVNAIPTAVLVDKRGKVRYWGHHLPDEQLIESVSSS